MRAIGPLWGGAVGPRTGVCRGEPGRGAARWVPREEPQFPFTLPPLPPSPVEFPLSLLEAGQSGQQSARARQLGPTQAYPVRPFEALDSQPLPIPRERAQLRPWSEDAFRQRQTLPKALVPEPWPGGFCASVSPREAEGRPWARGRSGGRAWGKGGRRRGAAPPVGWEGGPGGAGPQLARQGPGQARGPPGVRRRGVGLGGAALLAQAAGSSCPERRNNGEAGGAGDREEGAGASRKGETKEPSVDCHLHVTSSLSPPFFLPLVPAAVGLGERIVHTDVGFQPSAARRGLPRPGGAPTCSCDGGSSGRLGVGRERTGERTERPVEGPSRPGSPSRPNPGLCSALGAAASLTPTRSLGRHLGSGSLGRRERLGTRPCVPAPPASRDSGPGQGSDLGKRGRSSIASFSPLSVPDVWG